MSNFFKKIDGKKTGIFAAGVLFGTAGIKLLTSRDAKKERFESFDDHVRYVLDAAVRLAEHAFCRRLVVTMSERHFCDDIANMLGVSVRMNDGYGFMALSLQGDDSLMSILHEASFFDEIV